MIFLFPDVVLWIKGRKTYQSNFARVVFNLFIIICYLSLFYIPDFIDLQTFRLQATANSRKDTSGRCRGRPL